MTTVGTLLVTLLVIGLGDALTITGGVVAVLPTLLCCTVSQGKYIEASFWLVAILLGQYFNSLPWIIIGCLPLVILLLFIIRIRLISEQSILGHALIVGAVFVPVFILSGIKDSMAIAGSVIWVVAVSLISFWLAGLRHQQGLRLRQG